MNSAQFQEMSAKKNNQLLEILRSKLEAGDMAKPFDIAQKLLLTMLSSKNLEEKAMAMSLLSPILHHSLKDVTPEKFVSEMDGAFKSYSAYLGDGMEKIMAAANPIDRMLASLVDGIHA